MPSTPNKIPRSLLCLISMIFPLFSPAQDTLFKSFQAHQISIVFQPDDSSFHGTSNTIILQLAASRDINPKKLKIRIAFAEEIEIHCLAEEKPMIILRIPEISVAGREQYRGFRLEEVLIPDRMSCTFDLISLPDSIPLRRYRLSNLDLVQLATGYKSAELPIPEPGKLGVDLTDFEFSYSDAAWQRFREKLSLINDYYAASALVDTLLNQREMYDPMSVRNLPGTYVFLLEVNKIVNLLDEKKLPDRLELDSYDPQDYTKKFSALFRFSRSASMTFGQELPKMDSVPWNGNLELLTKQYIRHLMRYVTHSLLLNGIRSNLYDEYLIRYFEIPAFKNDQTTFLTLVQKMYPYLNRERTATMITGKIRDAYLLEASQLINQSSFAEALKLLKNADSFLNHTHWFGNYPRPDSLIALAVKGVYISYLGIAESCIDMGNFRLAENYITKAGDYKRNYPFLLPPDTLLKRVFRKLFNRQLVRCDNMLSGNLYEEALECYQLFEHSYPPDMVSYVSSHLLAKRNEAVRGELQERTECAFAMLQTGDTDSALVCYDRACGLRALIPDDPEGFRIVEDLQKRILPVRYRTLADRGEYLALTSRYEEAYQVFTEMKTLGETNRIPFDRFHDSLFNESRKHHLLNEISLATGMIWNDQLNEAQTYAREIESVMDVYNLQLDADIQAALIGYHQKIEHKICQNIIDEIGSLAIRAQKNLELLQFDVAITQLGEARLTAQKNPACKISTNALTDTINRYISAAFYQEKQKQALQLVAIGQYRDAIQITFDNEIFFRTKQLEILNVPFEPPESFIRGASLVPFTKEAVMYSIQSGNVDSSWKYLSMLKLQEPEAKKIREQQEIVGQALAGRDFRQNPLGNMVGQAKLYTGGDRWFANFEMAYYDKWKHLFNETFVY